MFDNTLTLTDGAADIATAIIDGPAGRKTLRSSADGVTQLTIAHQDSNENPGYVTQRSNIRVSRSFEIEDTGKSVSAYAQLTLSVPKDTVDEAAAMKLIAMLVNFLALSEAGAFGSAIMDSASQVGAKRLYAGEP
jgi:hypothetical protein